MFVYKLSGCRFESCCSKHVSGWEMSAGEIFVREVSAGEMSVGDVFRNCIFSKDFASVFSSYIKVAEMN